jgi:hypothetical protein
MTGDGPYFGYETARNEQLMNARRMAAKMGDDIRYYPQPQDGGELPDFTINWANAPESVKDSAEAEANDTIEKIYKRIMAQDAGALYQLKDQWWTMYLVLDDIAGRVRKAAMGLKYGGDGTSTSGTGWTGKGADAFLARGPGATLKSLDDWKDAALKNYTGTAALAGVIVRHQERMKDLWDEYCRHMVQVSNEWLQMRTSYSSVSEIPPGTQTAKDYVTRMREEALTWHGRARTIQYEMAQEYWSVMNEELGGGRATVYEGPTNALRENPEFIARWQAGQFGIPNVTPPSIGTPNIGHPDIAPPNIQAQVDIGQVTPPTVTPPTVTPPVVAPPDVAPPAVAPPLAGLPVVPPVAPPVPNVGQPSPAPAVRPPAAPNTSDLSRLLSNTKGSGVPSVLRPGNAGLPEGGRTPGLPQPPGKGQPHPPAQIKRPGQDAPATPPGKRGDGPTTKTPARPAAPGQSQFGGPPSRTPASPVLRAPRPAPNQPGPGLRSGQSAPLRPGAAPPVLNRPRPAAQQPTPPARPSAPPTADRAPLAPPKPATAGPVVGRSAKPVADAAPRPESSSGIVGRRRRSPGYEAELTSRKLDGAEARSRVDEEFEKIRRLLDQEGAWTVSTPGGGVLDGKPTKTAAPTVEPKPTLGT